MENWKIRLIRLPQLLHLFYLFSMIILIIEDGPFFLGFYMADIFEIYILLWMTGDK